MENIQISKEKILEFKVMGIEIGKSDNKQMKVIASEMKRLTDDLLNALPESEYNSDPHDWTEGEHRYFLTTHALRWLPERTRFVNETDNEITRRVLLKIIRSCYKVVGQYQDMSIKWFADYSMKWLSEKENE